MFLGVYWPEWMVLGLMALCWALYRHLSLGFRAPLQLYFERVKGTIPCYLVSLIIVFLILRLVHIQTARKMGQPAPREITFSVFKDNFLTRAGLIRDFRFLNLICIMFVVFVNMKHLIPLIHPGDYDYFFSEAEHKLFGGRAVGEILIQVIGTSWAPMVSAGYAFFYPFVAILIYSFVLQRNETLTVEFLTAFIMLWFLSLFLVYAVPTRGPFFSEAENFADLPRTEITSMQEKLVLHADILRETPRHPKAVFLISAFPSLHLAVAVLGAIYLRRIHTLLALGAWIFAAITVVTTLYFGWHFLVDDIGAVIIAIIVYRIADHLYRPRLRYVVDVEPAPPVQR